MFIEVFRAWSMVLTMSVVIWHSGNIARRYGWSMGKNAFFQQYCSILKIPKSGNKLL